MTPQAYNRHHIALMTEYVRGTTASRPINDEYMGIDGELILSVKVVNVGVL